MSSLGRIAVHSRRIFERSKVGAAILKGGNPIVDTSVSTIHLAVIRFVSCQYIYNVFHTQSQGLWQIITIIL